MLNSTLLAVCGILHLGFMFLEMYLWDKPFGRKTFRLSIEQAAATKVLAANQGLYNGILAAGLFWSITQGFDARFFFFTAVVVAGIYGALTVSRRIFWIQAFPALVGLATLYFGI